MCAYACLSMCVCERADVEMHECMNVGMCVCICACVSMHVALCMYVSMFLYVRV